MTVRPGRDVFGARASRDSLHYVTAHDGFTLADLVSHAQRHNEANGEHNRDGTADNGSWNNGLFTFLGNSLADDSTFTFNGQSWQIDYNASSGGSNFSSEYLSSSSYVNITAVPEPATWALLAFSLTTVIVLRRRRI